MQDAGLVADGVVLLVVDDVVERADLRELLRNGVQQGSAQGEVLAEADDDHHRAGVRRAHEHVAQLAVVLADVVEGNAVLQAELLDKEADLIGRFGLQVAALDVQDLVEIFPDVEAQAGAGGHAGGDLLTRHPALAGGGEFEFVAVVAGLVGAQDGAELRHLEVADARQLVIDLALLRRELDLVGEGLPAASAANGEMLAKRLQALLGGLHELDDRALEPGLLLADQPHVHHVARHGKADEHHLPFGRMRDRLALRRHALDREVLQNDIQLAVSCHRLNNNLTNIAIFRHTRFLPDRHEHPV